MSTFYIDTLSVHYDTFNFRDYVQENITKKKKQNYNNMYNDIFKLQSLYFFTFTYILTNNEDMKVIYLCMYVHKIKIECIKYGREKWLIFKYVNLFFLFSS